MITTLIDLDSPSFRRRWSETGGVVSNTGARLAWEREIQAAEVKPLKP